MLELHAGKLARAVLRGREGSNASPLPDPWCIEGDYMVRSARSCFFVALCAAAGCAGEPKQSMRPITEAESVLAAYREDLGDTSAGTPAIILAAWPDGHIVWSGDRVQGGAPYRSGHIDPQKVAALLARFEKDGLFADEKLNQAHFGPDAQFITLFIKSGKKRVQMQSWHELFEASDRLVVTNTGAGTLDGRRRLDVLRKEPAGYLFFRFVWSETRAKLTDLIPGESRASAGKPVMKAGVLSWRQPAAEPQPGGASDPSMK